METIGRSFLPDTVKGCRFRRIHPSPDTNDVNTQINQRIPKHTHTHSAHSVANKTPQNWSRFSQEAEAGKYLLDCLVPWSARWDECLADTTEGAPDDWYRFLCVSPSLSLSLSELCAKNGQCLCARQNFNEGGRRW